MHAEYEFKKIPLDSADCCEFDAESVACFVK